MQIDMLGLLLRGRRRRQAAARKADGPAPGPAAPAPETQPPAPEAGCRYVTVWEARPGGVRVAARTKSEARARLKALAGARGRLRPGTTLVRVGATRVADDTAARAG